MKTNQLATLPVRVPASAKMTTNQVRTFARRALAIPGDDEDRINCEYSQFEFPQGKDRKSTPNPKTSYSKMTKTNQLQTFAVRVPQDGDSRCRPSKMTKTIQLSTLTPQLPASLTIQVGKLPPQHPASLKTRIGKMTKTSQLVAQPVRVPAKQKLASAR